MTFKDAIKTWGLRAVKTVLRKSLKYGVINSSSVYSDGKKG